MKCQYCGGSLGLEDQFCPHCGRPNELAANHIKDMQHFESEFNTTEIDVKNQARKWSGISVRAVVLIVMVILIAINTYVCGNAYRIIRMHREHVANLKYDEYSKTIDKKLANGEYRAVNSIIENNNIDTYETKYEKYATVSQACSQFEWVEHYAEAVAIPDKYGSREDDYSNLSDSILTYYKEVYDLNTYDRTPVEYKKYLDDMTHQVEMTEVVNLGITKDDAANLKTMNERQRQNFINDSIENILKKTSKKEGTE